jgi:hypothetical protein
MGGSAEVGSAAGPGRSRVRITDESKCLHSAEVVLQHLLDLVDADVGPEHDLMPGVPSLGVAIVAALAPPEDGLEVLRWALLEARAAEIEVEVGVPAAGHAGLLVPGVAEVGADDGEVGEEARYRIEIDRPVAVVVHVVLPVQWCASHYARVE